MKPAVIVTGAGSGIGCEIARQAAREGSIVLLVDIQPRPLTDFAAELTMGGAHVHAFVVNLLDPDAGERIEGVLSEHGLFCDVLVNNAGSLLYGLATEIDRGAQIDLLDLNARVLTDLTLRFLPGMVSRGRGGVLNVASISSYAPGPMLAVYHATKAYVRLLSFALAVEVAGTGVTITCLNPGIVRTSFVKSIPKQTYLRKLLPRTDPADIAKAGWRGFRAGKRVVMPRWSDHIIRAFLAVLPDRVTARLILALHREKALAKAAPGADLA